jgi:hypothetical protein
MKLLMPFVFLFIISALPLLSKAQVNNKAKVEKIKIDSNLSENLFNFERLSYSTGHSTLVVSIDDNGRRDTITNISTDTLHTVNAAIRILGFPGILFDSCGSHLAGDTIVIAFSSMAVPANSMTIFIVGDVFYVGKTLNNGEVDLVVVNEELILKHPITKRGDQLRGIVKLQCVNQNPAIPLSALHLSGSFTCRIH